MQINSKHLRQSLGFFLNNVFEDQEFLSGLVDSVAFRSESTYWLEQNLKNYMSRQKIPSSREIDTRIYFFDTDNMSSTDTIYGGTSIYGSGQNSYGGSAIDPERPRFPVGKYKPAYLGTSLLSPETVYVLGRDYIIQDDHIIFIKNPLFDDTVEKRYLADSSGAVRRTFFLWGFKTKYNAGDLCDFYGTVVGVCSSEDQQALKDAINLAWDMRQDGVSDENLNRTLSLITGVDYVHSAGRVKEIYEEGDSVIVRTEDNTYAAPVDCPVLVEEGQDIEPAQEIFGAYSITYPNQELPEGATSGLALGPSYIPSLSDGILVPNIYSEIFKHRPEGWYELVREGSVFLKKDRDGRIIETIPESEATEEINNAPEEEYRFVVYGSEADKDIFFSNLNKRSSLTRKEENECGDEVDRTQDLNFFDLLKEKYGRVPIGILPLTEIYGTYLGSNSIFIKINKIAVTDALMSQLLNTVSKTIPAGSTMFVSVDATEITDENISSNQLAEAVEVFYIVDIEETDASNKKETVIAVPQI